MVNWNTFHPIKKWLLVKADPRMKTTKGGIHLPNQLIAAERLMEGTGIVLRVGSKVSEIACADLEPGTRICFRGFLKDASSMEFEPHEDGCAVFMLRVEDVMAIIPANVSMGFAS